MSSAAARPKLLVWLSLWVFQLTELIDRVGYALSRWVYWLGAPQARKEFEASREVMQAEMAQALIDALGPGAMVSGTTPSGAEVVWGAPPAKGGGWVQ